MCLYVMNAMTVHRWSGIGDGSYISQKLQQLVCHDEQCAGAKERIISTVMLIIDDISMMNGNMIDWIDFYAVSAIFQPCNGGSRNMLDKLGTVCRIINIIAAFGGIQLIVVGDFLQLPPVKNTHYIDLLILSQCFPFSENNSRY